MIQIENPRVVAAIIDCLNLPVNRQCDVVVLDKCTATFVYDIWSNDEEYVCRFPAWFNFRIGYYGPVFTIMHPYSIGHWEINCETGESRYICAYNKEGKIKFGRFYESSMD